MSESFLDEAHYDRMVNFYGVESDEAKFVLKKLKEKLPVPNSDVINNPPHYTFSKIQTIDAIEAWGLDFHLGNAIKYISRAQHKGRYLEDLEKAQWYVARAIAKAKGESK